MRISAGTHLTYCTNVHAGEQWPAIRENLLTHVKAVKAQVCSDRPFGVGLWLSAAAVESLREPHARADLKTLLAEHGFYVFTLNGFPYGAFHGARIKEQVYEPDWRDPKRLAYSNALATLLAELLPEGGIGSISTLPVGFGPALRSDDAQRAAGENLLRHAAHLAHLHETTGKLITLALEPEPWCLLETTGDAIAFFERHLQSPQALRWLANLIAASTSRSAEVVARHLGLCIDACHAAVQFEDPAELVTNLRAANITLAKIQLSCGLRLPHADAPTRRALIPYLDEVYLHQVVQRRDTTFTRYLDLPEALRAAESTTQSAPEWRIHFHVPIFLEHLPHFSSTQPFLRELLALQRTQSLTPHLEVETYTWDVLPTEARPTDLTEAIAQELRFCIEQLSPKQ